MISPGLYVGIVLTITVLLPFGLCYFIFRARNRQVTPFKRVAFWATWVIGMPITYVVCVLSFIVFVSYTPSEAFTIEQWQRDKEHRTWIVDDLMSSKRLDGLTREEVVEVLGPPDSTDYFAGTQRDLVYWLGDERGFMSVDSEWLLIWLKDGRVARYKVVTD